MAKSPKQFQAMTERRQRTWAHFINSTKIVIIVTAVILGLMAFFLTGS